MINAAAWTRVDAAEEHETTAEAVNATGAGHVAMASAAAGIRCCQVSTDYVFDGTATSPIVDDDKCIVFVGGNDKGALMALDTRTGEVHWSWDGDGPGYASPIVAVLSDTRQVVTQSQKARHFR